MTVRIVQVIYCDEGRAGRGSADDVVRSVPSLYTLDGELICEYDSGPQSRAPMTEQTVHGGVLMTLGNARLRGGMNA